MKKYVLIVLFAFLIILSGCKQPIECNDNQKLEGDVCVDIPLECPSGQEEVNGVCQTIEPEKTELEKAFDNSINASNYKMVVEITKDNTTAVITMLFDENKSSVQVGDEIEYYTNNNGVCEKVTVQLDNTITETIDCIDSDDFTYQFFHGLKIEQFEEFGENYKLKENNYALLTNFMRISLSDAVVSNFVLEVENDYFSTFTYEVASEGETYTFVFTLSMYDQVSIVVPE